MKKLLATALVLFAIISLVSCTGTPAGGNDSKVDDQNEESAATSGSDEDKKEISFSEITVVDNDECSIKITGIEKDNFWGYTLKAQIENKSAEKTYMFSVRDAAVNGVQTDVLFANEVAPGKKSNESISFTDQDLENNGIDDFTDIELYFRVYDNDDWTADAVAEESVHIYPYGEEYADKYVRETLESDNVILDNEYATVIVTGYENDDIWGYTVNLFLINKTDKTVMFSVDEASVNGFMADPLFASTVMPEKCAFTSMSWSETTLEENSITDVQNIEFKLSVNNYDDWSEDDYANEVITLNP